MAENDTYKSHSLPIASLTLSCNFWSIMCNGAIIATITKTNALQGYSGKLLISQAVADICLEISTILIYIHVPLKTMIISPDFIRILTTLGIAFHGIVAYSIMASGWNLYLATCGHLTYRFDMTWRKLAKIILFSWLFNLVLPFLHYTTNDYFVWGERLLRLFPTYTSRNWWFGVLCVTNVTLMPLCVTVGYFYKIRKYTRSLPAVVTNGEHSHTSRKIKLALMNIVIMILHITSFLPLHLVQACKVTTPGVSSFVAICYYSYHMFKIFLFMKLFKPFRKTIRSFCCCCDSEVTPTQTALEGATQMMTVTSEKKQVSLRTPSGILLRPHNLAQNLHNDTAM